MPPAMNGIILVFVGTTLFSSKSVLIQLAFMAGASVDQLMLIRMLLALPFYMLIGFLAWRTLQDKPNIRTLVLIALSGFACYHLASYLDMWALQFINAGLERIILFSYPAIVVLFKTLCGERLHTKQLLGLGIAYLGVFLFFYEDLTANPNLSYKAVLAVFIAAVLTAIYMLASQKYGRRFSGDFFTAVAMGITGFTIPTHYIAMHGFTLSNINNNVWLYGSLLSIVFTVLASVLLNRGVQIVGAVRASVLGMLGPMLTLFLAAWFLQQPLTAMHAVATVITITGIVMVTRKI